MSKYRARRVIQVGDDIYNPGDILVDPPEIVESWVKWGDVEQVEEVAEHKPVKKAAAKKTAHKKDH